MRQPVMQKYLENELMTTARSDSFAAVSAGKGVIEPVINLVRDDADALAFRRRDQCARNASAAIIVPVGLAGLATTQAGERRLAMRRRAALRGVSAQRVSGAGFDQHRLAAERRQDMPVRRIAGIGERDAIARLEQREKRQNEAAGRAGGHRDLRRIERRARKSRR